MVRLHTEYGESPETIHYSIFYFVSRYFINGQFAHAIMKGCSQDEVQSKLDLFNRVNNKLPHLRLKELVIAYTGAGESSAFFLPLVPFKEAGFDAHNPK